MAKLTGAHLLVRCLKQEGIRRVFTIVGDTILPFCDAWLDEGLEYIDTRHEAAAMNMAAGWAQMTGEPAVAVFTGGPGFSNAISALPHIYTTECPVIFINGCGALHERGMSSFQEIDQVAMAAPVTKGSWMVDDRRRIPEYVATAFRTAISGRPGPVVLALPEDMLYDATEALPRAAVTRPAQAPCPDAMQAMMALMQDPGAMQAWFQKKRDAFDALLEDDSP